MQRKRPSVTTLSWAAGQRHFRDATDTPRAIAGSSGRDPWCWSRLQDSRISTHPAPASPSRRVVVVVVSISIVCRYRCEVCNQHTSDSGLALCRRLSWSAIQHRAIPLQCHVGALKPAAPPASFDRPGSDRPRVSGHHLRQPRNGDRHRPDRGHRRAGADNPAAAIVGSIAVIAGVALLVAGKRTVSPGPA